MVKSNKKKGIKKPTIAMLIPMTSKNQKWKSLGECSFLTDFLANFMRTAEYDKYNYRFYIGIDDNDDFFISQKKNFIKKLKDTDRIITLENCNGNPCLAWNILAETAKKDNCNYYYQIGDDIKIMSYNWTTYFIKILENQNNFGIVGGVDNRFYIERLVHSIPIIENAFFHKNNFLLYPKIFNEKLKNWWSDDFITNLWYNLSVIVPQVRYINTNRVSNSNKLSRYKPENKCNWQEWLYDDLKLIEKNIYENNLDDKISSSYKNKLKFIKKK